jgi:hypothetical protein
MINNWMQFQKSTDWCTFEWTNKVFWVTISAIVSTSIGLVMGTIGLKSLRSKDHEQAEIPWKQTPLSPWKYETLTIIAISIHTLGLIGLAAFVCLSAARINFYAPGSNAISSFLLSALSWFAVFFVTYSSGVAVSYHFAQAWISPVSYGISGEGLWYGGMLIGWKSYSHYEIGPDAGLISLYSSYSPPLRTWVLQPPADSFAGVLGLIQKNLPSIPPAADSVAWQHSPPALILEMVMLVIGTLLAITWGWFQSPSLVWMYAFIAFFFVQYLGIKLMTLFDGRGQTSGAES